MSPVLWWVLGVYMVVVERRFSRPSIFNGGADMGKEKQPTDEQIITALLANKTLRATAAAVGISERALYTRMNDSEFSELYQATKADLLREAVLNFNGKIHAAIETVAQIMQDKDNNPAVRLQAAQTILNNAGKFAQRLQDDENELQGTAKRNEWRRRI